MAWTAYIDGGSRGNPGPAAAGVVLRNPAGETVFAGAFVLGRQTNNHAEYQGLLNALELLAQADANEIDIASDSELLVRQISGQYKVKSPELRPLFEEARQKFTAFKTWKIRHVRREENAHADQLVNKALDAKRDVILADKLRLVRTSKPAASPAREQPSLFPGEAGGSQVLVQVVRGPESGACPGGTRKGQAFSFTSVTPAGMCLDACAAVIDAVLALEAIAPADAAKAEPMTVRCGRPGCGAVFEIRRS